MKRLRGASFLKAIYFLSQFEHGHFSQSVPMLMERSSKLLKNGAQLVLASGEQRP